MGGRKGAVAPTVVVDAVLLYKDEVVVTNSNGEKKVAVATDSVWCKISTYLNNRMSGRALHTFVHKDRYNVKEKLGFPSQKPILVSRKFNDEAQPSYETADSFSDSSSDEQNFMPTKKFVITFSADEWQQIKPQETIYKLNEKSRPTQSTRTYLTLAKNTWTPILAEHFWIHNQLPCCLSFNRAKVYATGSSYVSVIGRCTICNSLFKGIIEDMPPENARVLMKCTYSGNFNDAHKLLKKRRLIGPAKTKVIDSIFNVGLSCETYRESEAGRLMKIGNCEPAIIPTGNSLRALKSRKLANDRRHEDTLSSLAIMKMENEYINVIHDIGYDPFYVYYYCAEQIHLYRGYCNSTQIPKLIIDATGSVVKKFRKFGEKKTNSLYLYEALVYDSTKKVNFTVTNMVSEKHDNVCISKWLINWINSDVKKPKETVCDNSLALLSAVVQSFTQYTSLQVYIRICSDLLTGELSTNSHLVPWCFVRIDVAHFLKICTQWAPLKTVPRRVREIILRVVGLLIKCKSLIEAQSLLHSLFVVLVNETNGIDGNGQETPCEMNSKILIDATSTGLVLFEQQFNDLLAAAETEDEARNFLEDEYEGLNDYDNPFQSWADNIHNRSKGSIQEGSGINPLYLPTLAPYIIKSMKLLPLWSGIMISIFGYGDDISTSAAVESSFKKLKTVTFKHISIPIDLEHFLENHIKSLKGAALLRSSCKNIVISSLPEPCETIDDSHSCTSPTIISNNLNENENMYIENRTKSPPYDALYVVERPIIKNSNTVELQLELDDNLQTQSLQFIKIPPGNCTIEESRAVESWDRKSKKERKNNSYLNPNPHLRHLNISTAKNKQTLPILKNGSRFAELKSCKSREGNLIFSNTCAFDALAALLMVSYCDSYKFATAHNNMYKHVEFLNFISNIITDGVSKSTYSKRADIIITFMSPDVQELEYGNSLVTCDATMSHAINTLLSGIPSAKEVTECISSTCEKSERSIMYLTYQMGKEGRLDDLQTFLDERTETDFINCPQIGCENLRSVKTNISKLNLFIDILYWEGENVVVSSEAANIFLVRLCDIPPIIICETITYELRGVIAFRQGKSKLRNSIGHYTTYAKRDTRNWELYDDLKIKPVPVKDTTIVPCEFLLYTI